MNNKEQLITQLSENNSLQELSDLMFLNEAEYYEEKPVDIITFATDPYYLGKTYGEGRLYKFWQDTLKEIYPIPMYSPYSEILLSAAIGAGKTSCSIIGLCYDTYKLMCLKNPQEYYGLTPNTTFVIALFSSTLTLASDVNWTTLMDAISESPYFMDRLVDKKAVDRKAKASVLPLIKKIGIQIGSKFEHTIGKAVFSALLDEASFQSKSLNRDQAQETYNALFSRSNSRFEETILRNTIPGHIYIASSPSISTGFLDKKVKESATRKDILAKTNIARWHCKTSLIDDSEGFFYVKPGTQESPSLIVDSIAELSDNEKALFHRVPSKFRKEFENDLDLAIRDSLGIGTSYATRLIRDMKIVTNNMVFDNPVNVDIITELTYNGKDQIQDFIDIDYFKNPRYPRSNRFIMVDPGVTSDVFGIASVFCTTAKETIGGDTESAYEYANRIYFNDFVLGIKGSKQERVNFTKVKIFLDFLVNIGYPVVQLGSDQFQSEDLLQTYDQKGWKTKKLSVVSDVQPYEFLRDTLKENRCYLPKSKTLERELGTLTLVPKNKGKYMYDHPSDSSKDLSDCVAGALWMCAQAPIKDIASVTRSIIEFYKSETVKDENYYKSLSEEEFIEELKNNPTF